MTARGVGVPSSVLDARQEETLVALDVVLLNVGGLEPEVYRDAVGGLPVVVVEVLSGLDVVLVAVGPVQVDLLAVVGDGVPLAAPVAPLGDKVSVLVVPAEESVQVVIDVGLDGAVAAPSRGDGRALGFQVGLANVAVRESDKVAVGVDGVFR